MEKITVMLEIDAASLNKWAGNVGNTPLRAAVTELLDSIFGDFPFYCERCGTAHQEPTGIKGRFTIVEDSP